MSARQNVAIRVQTEGKAEVKRDWQEIGQAGVGAHDQVARSSDQAGAAMDRQMAKWKVMAAAAREAEQVQARQAQFNAVLGVGAGSGKSAADSAAVFMEGGGGAANSNLSRVQQMMLQSAGFRTFESLASGMSPARIALQQGGEVAAAFGMGEGGLGGVLSGVLKLINPLTVGFGLLTGAVVAGGLAAASYESQMHKLEIATRGLGSAQGATVEQVNAVAVEVSKSGAVTVSAARDMAAGYLSTGKIGVGALAPLIEATREYALVTGQKAKEATTELGKAFADPVKGAEELNAKLHFLDDSTMHYIQTLVAHGQTSDAQVVLAVKLRDHLASLGDQVGFLGRMWQFAKKDADDFANAVGHAIATAVGGGTTIDKMHRLQVQIDRVEAGQGLNMEPIAGAAQQSLLKSLRGQMDALGAGWTEEQKRLSQGIVNDAAQTAEAAIAKTEPLSKKLRDLQTQRSEIQKGLDLGALDSQGQKEAHDALKTINADIDAIGKGYKSAADMASKLKEAQHQSAEEARKAAAEAQKHAEEARKLEQLRVENMAQIAKLQGDKKTLAALEEQVRLQKLIKDYEGAGLTTAQARAAAYHQIGQEMAAWNQGQVKATEDAAQGIKLTTDSMKAIAAQLAKITPAAAALEDFRRVEESAFDTFAAKLTDTQGRAQSWGDTIKSVLADVVAEFEKLALINPLKNMLFSQNNPTLSGSNVGSFITSLFGHNADGTDNWRGGWTTVGERGPELVNLPRGAQVFSNVQSGQMGGTTIHISMDARGADASAARAVQLQLDRLRADLPGLIVQNVNDGVSRRRIV